MYRKTDHYTVKHHSSTPKRFVIFDPTWFTWILLRSLALKERHFNMEKAHHDLPSRTVSAAVFRKDHVTTHSALVRNPLLA